MATFANKNPQRN